MRVEFAEKLAGTCKDMCPEKERYMREVQRQLTSYEMARDGEVDHLKAIKAYSRSSADQEEPLPHELRPTPTLEMSMLYILHNIIPREETSEDLGNWYNFVWDRTRSIRKDITQQQLFDIRAVNLMEKCARFHIHCSSRLSELDRHAFDPKLNDENLMKCLQSLEHMYTDLNLMGQTCKNEPEFRAYQILMNLNEGDILWYF
ncbi:unnamed protein product [Allacma fusca]|uniref:SAC3/GANP/THP3 conserved domain-containing protein n=1 Tax=Allacma fusca TaxID=39272 RepID=A0A8J2KV31_9HEXA|nr:unnamed protein product [Allacma fusca]